MKFRQNKKIWGAVAIMIMGGTTVAYMLALFALLCLQEHAVIPKLGAEFWANCGKTFDGLCWAVGAATVFALTIALGYLFVGRIRQSVASFILTIGALVMTFGMTLVAYIPFFPVALVIDSARRSVCGQ